MSYGMRARIWPHEYLPLMVIKTRRKIGYRRLRGCYNLVVQSLIGFELYGHLSFRDLAYQSTCLSGWV